MNPPCARCGKIVYPTEKVSCLDKVSPSGGGGPNKTGVRSPRMVSRGSDRTVKTGARPSSGADHGLREVRNTGGREVEGKHNRARNISPAVGFTLWTQIQDFTENQCHR